MAPVIVLIMALDPRFRGEQSAFPSIAAAEASARPGDRN
jgi:hypothetical protein